MTTRSHSQAQNKQLWTRAKKEADKHYAKPSAYKSGFIVKFYKEHGGKFVTRSKSKTKGLTRWFAEKWTNQRGEVGYSKKGDIYRPSKKNYDKDAQDMERVIQLSNQKG